MLVNHLRREILKCLMLPRNRFLYTSVVFRSEEENSLKTDNTLSSQKKTESDPTRSKSADSLVRKLSREAPDLLKDVRSNEASKMEEHTVAKDDPSEDIETKEEDPAKNRISKAETLEESKLLRQKRKEKSMERNFVTSVRAMADFLLRPEDLIGLRKTMRRSPHSDEPPITVFWRKDIEAKVTDIFGSMNAMKQERAKRLELIGDYSEVVMNIKKVLKRYKKEHPDEDIDGMGPSTTVSKLKGGKISKHDPKYDPFVRNRALGAKSQDSLFTGSGRIVLAAVTINGTNFVIKFIAWWFTGSHSLFAESIHSLADTMNQCILAFGIHKSTQRANTDHPYGYSNMKYVASLVSGVGIFCIGSGLSFYHGVTGLMSTGSVDESVYWAFYILAGSFISEGATLFMAANAARKRANALKIPFKQFVLRSHDPSLNVVMLEDTAAVSGVFVAALCMGISMYTGSPIADACGSLVIGGLLGGVASFIVYTNGSALVGRSIPREQLENINLNLEQDVMVRAIHDVKGMDMGNSLVRYKAEVDFDGRELSKIYLDKQDLSELLEDIRHITTEQEVEEFVLTHGENIIDTLGAEIDRIENRLKQDHPEIRHCDLEIL